jgi:hypothetical protein
MGARFFLFLAVVLVSCASKKTVTRFSNIGETQAHDYSEHLQNVGNDYRKSGLVNLISLNAKSREYLIGLHKRITKNNELFFQNEDSKPEFYIIGSKTPFVFSLPGNQYYFSSGLLTKYLNNEELLAAVLTIEMVRVDKNLYEKKILVPTGSLSTEMMLSITGISLELKSEINKWAYYVLKRAGIDPFVLLNWIQLQNKNTLDFSMQMGSALRITKEEASFKNFVVQQGAFDERQDIRLPRSSGRDFYSFLHQIKKVNP